MYESTDDINALGSDQVIFACQDGISSCQGYLALQHVMHHLERDMDASVATLENKQPLTMMVYDGAFDDYKVRQKEDQEIRKKRKEFLKNQYKYHIE